ncbi:MAG: TonB-dependent receptor, partial [Terracidiphilus sp.]
MPSFIGDSAYSGDTFSINGQVQIINPFFQMGDLMRQDFEDGHELQTLPVDPDSQIRGYDDSADGHTGIHAATSVKSDWPHGVVYWIGGNSALNANSYLLAGQPSPNPSYNSNSYGSTIAGHSLIPYLTRPRERDALSISYAGESSTQLVNDFGVVPTEQDRKGDFSALIGPTGLPVTIYSPRTHLPYPNNVINTPLNPAAFALLAYLPEPNLQSSGLNYRLLTTQGLHTNLVGASYGHQFDASNHPSLPHQSVYLNFNYGDISNDVINIFPPLGGAQWIGGYFVAGGYTVGARNWITNISIFSSRNNAQLTNYFTNGEDIATSLGLYNDYTKQPINSNPTNYGLPNLVFNNYTAFSETQPRFQLTQRAGVTGAASRIHGAHNVRFGGDLDRVDFNIFGGTNATGSYIFTGGYTQDESTLGVQVPTSGSSFADFLTGFPQETSIESAAQKAHMLQTNYDLYVRDDWQLFPNLTLVAGLRYDYYAPFVEKNNRLSTLDYAPDFSNVAPVQPNGVGPISGITYPRSIINPDRNNFSPHAGLAWAAAKDTMVRAGYGIYYTEAQYATFIQNLAYQPPFAHVEANGNFVGLPPFATLQYGFGNTADDGNYAVNHSYRVPYVQVWYLDVQRSLPLDIGLDVGYEGAKGTRLDVISAPGYFNSTPFSSAYFDFEDSTAFSNFNALVVRANKRLRNGLAFEATYAYSHSIDDASSIEAGSPTVAQNWQDILAEESNSSFDIRHELTASFFYQLPFGRNKPYLNENGWLTSIFGDWVISGFVTAATGMPLTPFIAASVPEVERGTHGSVRPNRVPGTSLKAGGGRIDKWFNTAAFSSDFAPNQEFGTASRYSI